MFVIQGKSTNKAWQPYVQSLDVAPGRAAHPTINWSAMLPRDRQTFRYSGSLTTPPCTEGLRWVVMTTPVTLSGRQIAAFRAAYDHNNRPVQPRTVARCSWTAAAGAECPAALPLGAIPTARRTSEP